MPKGMEQFGEVMAAVKAGDGLRTTRDVVEVSGAYTVWYFKGKDKDSQVGVFYPAEKRFCVAYKATPGIRNATALRRSVAVAVLTGEGWEKTEALDGAPVLEIAAVEPPKATKPAKAAPKPKLVKAKKATAKKKAAVAA